MSDDRELLTKARELLADDPARWVKNRWGDEDGHCCCLGAINLASGREVSSGPVTGAELYLCTAIGELFPQRGLGVASFNDHASTEFADVLRAFDRAIELAASPS